MELGGNLTWDPPEELDLVDSYQATGWMGMVNHGIHGTGEGSSCYIQFSDVFEVDPPRNIKRRSRYFTPSTFRLHKWNRKSAIGKRNRLQRESPGSTGLLCSGGRWFELLRCCSSASCISLWIAMEHHHFWWVNHRATWASVQLCWLLG